MKKNNSLWIQLYVNIILSVVILFKYPSLLSSANFGILFLIILIQKHKLVWQLLSTIFLPFIFFNQFYFVINSLIKTYPNLTVVLYILSVIGALIIIIPITVQIYGRIKLPIYQLISTFWITFSIFMSGGIDLTYLNNEVLTGLNRSGLITGLVILLYTYLSIKSWKYKFYFNLPMKRKYIVGLIVGVLLGFWFSFFVVFSSMALNYKEVFWNWNFSLINPAFSARINNIWEIYFSSIAAGITEESERYINLILLFAIFKNIKFRIEWAILISSLLFAVPHIFNVFALPPYKLSVSMALEQAIFAFGLGCYLAVIFLLSGKLWIPMIIHTFYDSLVFSITSIGTVGGVVFDRMTYLMITTIGWLILAVIIFLCNKNCIKNNILILTQKNYGKIR